MKYVLNGRLTVKQETKSNTNISQGVGSYTFLIVKNILKTTRKF